LRTSHPSLVYGNSTSNFTITGTITVATPNGNENWTVGDTNRYINWSKVGNYSTSNFSIALSEDGGGNWTDISGLTNRNQTDCACAADDDCSILWPSIPDNVSSTLKIKVYAVANSGINDTSNGNFSIKPSLNLTYPSAAGIIWNSTENGTINWTKTGNWSGNAVNLSYIVFTQGVPGPDMPIPNGTSVNASDGGFTWYNITPDAISDYVKIKVSSVQPDA